MRVILKLDKPRHFDVGELIPIWGEDGGLADYAQVIACFSDGSLIVELPDNEAGRLMFDEMARELNRTREIAELDRLSKL